MKALSEAAEITPDDLQVRLRAELGDGNFRMSFTNKIDGKSRSLGTWALFRPKPWPNTGKSAKRQCCGRQQGYGICDNPGRLACTGH
jgi:hypothetical protein